MTAAADPLTTLVESIADGEPVDWDALGDLAGDSELRALVDHLRLVADVAELHRTQSDEPDTEAGAPFDNPADVDDERARWGHLALVRRLGQGAFGEVYLAHDTWLDHPRALKLLKPEVATRLSPEQLLHEARKLVRVRHPNVVAVHGADRHDGRVGFWMDFIDGRTLADLVADECFTAEQASRIGCELCDALSAVHRANLIHRDIKAQNVMRTEDGRIFLMDFGAGEFIGTSPRGRPQGTPLYLAPELFAGGAASVQSDVYAVGVLLYYLVTGGFPVEAASVTELIDAHAAGASESLHELHPELPERFARAVDRALDADPSRRFSSAEEMRDALVEPVPETTGETARATTASRLSSYVARTALTLLVLAIVAELFGFLGWRSFQLALHVDSTFAPPLSEYFRLGREAILPFLIYWAGGVAGIGLLVGLDVIFGGHLTRLVRRQASSMSASTVARVSAGVCLLAVIAWLALVWTHWTMFETLFGLPKDRAGVSTGTLGPEFRDVNSSYGVLTAWLTFGLLSAALYVFPALARQRADRASLRPFVWIAITVAALAVGSTAVTRRLAWDRFEQVLYENRSAFVIGSSDVDLLLYSPSQPELGTVRVSRGDAALVRTGRTGRLVDR